ncbi:hypothetical protein ACFE04_015795 [Oxalis oulophora]
MSSSSTCRAWIVAASVGAVEALKDQDEGDVLYVFSWDYRMKLTAKSFRVRFEPLVEKTKIYAGSYFAIPLIRWFFILRKNAKIEKRNKAREQSAQALELPDLSLWRKLISARDMAQKIVIVQDCIIYSTDKDLFEQDYEAKEWDRRFGEIEKSE